MKRVNILAITLAPSLVCGFIDPAWSIPGTPQVQEHYSNTIIQKIGDQPSTDEAQERQEDLKLLGFYKGPIDGRLDDNSNKALREFNRAAGRKDFSDEDVLQLLKWTAEIVRSRKVPMETALSAVPQAIDAEDLAARGEEIYYKGDYAGAAEIFKQVLDLRERALGKENPFTLTSANDLAVTYKDLGRAEEAELLFLKALEARKRVLGEEHPDTVTTINLLGVLYQSQYQYADAEPYLRKALTLRRQRHGADDPATLQSANNLAVLLEAQGHYDEAEEIYLRTIEKMDVVLGKDDPETLVSINNLGFLYWSLGRFDEAEELYLRVLKARERVLEKDHPDIFYTANDLGTLYQEQGRLSDAEPLLIRALEGRKRALGEDHHETLVTANNLAGLFEQQERFDEAEALYLWTIDKKEKTLGPDSSETLTTINNLGLFYEDQGRYDEAERLLDRVIKARRLLLHKDHRDIFESAHALAGLYQSQGRFEQAEKLMLEAFDGRRKILGTEHPDTLVTANNLATLYEDMDRHAEAEPLYKQSIDVKLRTLGKDHTETLVTIDNLALLYSNSGREAEAFEVWNDALPALSGWTQKSGHDPDAQLTVPLDLQRYLSTALRSGFTTDDIGRQTFEAQGWLTFDALDKTLTDLGDRLAAEDPEAARLVRSKQDLRDDLSKLRDQYAQTYTFDGQNTALRKDLLEDIEKITKEIDRIEQVLTSQFSSLAELSVPRPLSVKEAQNLLKVGEAMIAYAISDSSLFIWFLSANNVQWTEIRNVGDRLERLTQNLKYSVNLADRTGPASDDRISAECLHQAIIPGFPDKDFNLCEANDLYRLVLQPFDVLLRDIDHLIVVPDGALEAIPFSMLTRSAPEAGQQPHWLIEDMAVTTLPTTSSLRVLRTAAQKDASAQKPYLGIAPVEFGPQRTGDAIRTGLSSLPGTLAEVRTLAEIMGSGNQGFVIKNDATEAFVKSAALSDYQVLSFATHALMSNESQLLTKGRISEPALVLASSDGTEDALLTASEAATLELNADWVLLSGCNTAAGQSDSAQGLSGLARAFFFAGARSLLVSHWSVADSSALAIMVETMRQTTGAASDDKAQALRKAMLKVMNQPGYGHPFFWAPFSLVGDNRRAGT